MFGLWDSIVKAINDFLISVIEGNLRGMFNDVNNKLAEISTDVGATPQSWNSGIYSLVDNLAESVILPIAGMIIAFVLCHELISTIIDRNNMQDADTFLFFKFFAKAAIAILIVSNAMTIIMGVFDIAQGVVAQSTGVIMGETFIDIEATIATMHETLAAMNTGELFLLMIETALNTLCMTALSVCITIVLYGRMLEIYMYSSLGAISLATLTNKEWNMGNNYIRGLIALAFQAFLILLCVGIYAVLIKSVTATSDIHGTVFSILCYTVILCFALFKTSSLSKSIFGAH